VLAISHLNETRALDKSASVGGVIFLYTIARHFAANWRRNITKNHVFFDFTLHDFLIFQKK